MLLFCLFSIRLLEEFQLLFSFVLNHKNYCAHACIIRVHVRKQPYSNPAGAVARSICKRPKIIIWKALGVPQLVNAAHFKHQEEEEISPNGNQTTAESSQLMLLINTGNYRGGTNVKPGPTI